MNKLSVTTSIRGQADLIEEIVLSFPDKGRILDIGTGSGLAARRFLEAGWRVSATGFDMDSYLGAAPLPKEIEVLADVDICNAHQFEDESFDAIWCAHVLEHVSNTGQALEELRRLLKPGGWLFIAVPPYKEQVVGGHVNSGWNLGSLMYVLADAGFGLADGRFIQHGYNVFGMVQRGAGKLPPGILHRANGDIEALEKAGRFPKGFNPKQGFSGRIHAVNWKWNCPPKDIPVPRKELASPPPVSPMRIGFFVPWITMGKGGTENVGQMMANAMARRGHEVTIFTFDDKRAPSRWPLDERIVLVHLPEADDEPADHRMAVEVASRNFDLLVGLHMNRTMLRYVRCAHRVGLPLVLSEHCNPSLPRWMGTFAPDERDIAMAGATLIHLLSANFMDTLHPSLHDRVRVVPNAVPHPQNLASLSSKKPRNVLLSVSRLVPRKNLSQLIDAFATICRETPQWDLHIVGDGSERAALQQRAKQQSIAERVIFHGEQNNVYPFYECADLFVTPSLIEGFGLTVAEAMAHGLPTIGFAACPGVNEQIIDGENGLLCKDANGTSSLAEGLLALMSDDTRRLSMGEKGRNIFLERYAEETVVEKWEEMFSEARTLRVGLNHPSHQQIMSVRLWESVWGPITQHQKY